jgi:hypothetical protein
MSSAGNAGLLGQGVGGIDLVRVLPVRLVGHGQARVEVLGPQIGEFRNMSGAAQACHQAVGDRAAEGIPPWMIEHHKNLHRHLLSCTVSMSLVSAAAS